MHSVISPLSGFECIIFNTTLYVLDDFYTITKKDASFYVDYFLKLKEAEFKDLTLYTASNLNAISPERRGAQPDNEAINQIQEDESAV